MVMGWGLSEEEGVKGKQEEEEKVGGEGERGEMVMEEGNGNGE